MWLEGKAKCKWRDEVYTHTSYKRKRTYCLVCSFTLALRLKKDSKCLVFIRKRTHPRTQSLPHSWTCSREIGILVQWHYKCTWNPLIRQITKTCIPARLYQIDAFDLMLPLLPERTKAGDIWGSWLEMLSLLVVLAKLIRDTLSTTFPSVGSLIKLSEAITFPNAARSCLFSGSHCTEYLAQPLLSADGSATTLPGSHCPFTFTSTCDPTSNRNVTWLLRKKEVIEPVIEFLPELPKSEDDTRSADIRFLCSRCISLSCIVVCNEYCDVRDCNDPARRNLFGDTMLLHTT